jgi:precorrin-6Y C5,15-methyltransferase (decarboxylating)
MTLERPRARAAVSVIGIGDDGCASLPARAFNALNRAQVLVGGERHLAFFADFHGKKIPIKKGLDALLEDLAILAEDHNIAVLASGDPLFYGIGERIVQKLGRDQVEFFPGPSSMQWAFARVGLKWDDATLLSVHGRPLEGILTKLRAVRKAALFTDGENSPARIAQRMVESNLTGWDAWVAEHLAGPEERIRHFSIQDLAETQDIGPLNVLILLRNDAAWTPPPVMPYLPEEVFARRMPKLGLITKREVRALSLANLQLKRGSVMWDIGAGSGSVAIEAAMLASEGRVFAIECDPEGVQICEENLQTHQVDNVRVIAGTAPDALMGLDDPDAVFVGGSKGNMKPILALAYERLTPGGRLVVNAVTLDNVSEAYGAFKDMGLLPEVTMVNISRGVPLAGKYLRYEALNPIHIFAVTKAVAKSGEAKV